MTAEAGGTPVSTLGRSKGDSNGALAWGLHVHSQPRLRGYCPAWLRRIGGSERQVCGEGVSGKWRGTRGQREVRTPRNWRRRPSQKTDHSNLKTAAILRGWILSKSAKIDRWGLLGLNWAFTDGQSSQDALWSAKLPWEGRKLPVQDRNRPSPLTVCRQTVRTHSRAGWSFHRHSKSSHSYSRETHTGEYRETVQGCPLQHQKLETENINGII